MACSFVLAAAVKTFPSVYPRIVCYSNSYPEDNGFKTWLGKLATLNEVYTVFLQADSRTVDVTRFNRFLPYSFQCPIQKSTMGIRNFGKQSSYKEGEDWLE